MTDLADRLRNHVRSRLPGSAPVIENGAWQMMLDAAGEIERLRDDCAELYQVIGTLALKHDDLFDNSQVIKALDNASAAADGRPRPHSDLLPFTPPIEFEI